MDNMQYKLIEWMAAALHEDNSRLEPVEPEEWPAFFQETYKQGLSFLFFPLAHTLPEENKPPPEVLSFWKRQVLYSATVQLHKLKQLKGIIDIFRKDGIPAIVFKGPAIARFYNQPEYRPMSDVDVLVQDRDKQRAHLEILSRGYVLKEGEASHPVHFEYRKEGSLHIELHHSLLHPGILGARQVEEWYGHIWKHARTICFNELEFMAMAEEDELINQILHLATHMIYFGALLKHIYDIAVILHRCKKMNWLYIRETLRTLKLFKFAGLVFLTCNHYFGLDVPEGMVSDGEMGPEEFLDDFFEKYSMEKEPGEKRGWRAISWNLPVLCRHPAVMLPVIWAIEVFLQIEIHKGNILLSIGKSWKNVGAFRSRVRMLKDLGLLLEVS